MKCIVGYQAVPSPHRSHPRSVCRIGTTPKYVRTQVREDRSKHLVGVSAVGAAREHVERSANVGAAEARQVRGSVPLHVPPLPVPRKKKEWTCETHVKTSGDFKTSPSTLSSSDALHLISRHLNTTPPPPPTSQDVPVHLTTSRCPGHTATSRCSAE